MSHAGKGLATARAHMAQLSDLLLQHTSSSGATSKASHLYQEGRLRLAWLQAEQQPQFCKYHFGGGQAKGSGSSSEGGSGPASGRAFCEASSWLSWQAWWHRIAGLGLGRPWQEAYLVAFRTSTFPSGGGRRGVGWWWCEGVLPGAWLMSVWTIGVWTMHWERVCEL